MWKRDEDGGGVGVEKLNLGEFLKRKCYFELLNWFWHFIVS